MIRLTREGNVKSTVDTENSWDCKKSVDDSSSSWVIRDSEMLSVLYMFVYNLRDSHAR